MRGIEKRAERLARELRRHERKIDALHRENAAMLERAQKAEKAGRLLGRTVELLLIRVGLAYGENVMDEAREKCVGKCLRLPRDDGDELLARWQAKARNAEELDAIVVAVGLRDDPDDCKSDAELAAEAVAAMEKSRNKGQS